MKSSFIALKCNFYTIILHNGQIWKPEFCPRTQKGGRRTYSWESCSLTSKDMQWHKHAHPPHIHTHTLNLLFILFISPNIFSSSFILVAHSLSYQVCIIFFTVFFFPFLILSCHTELNRTFSAVANTVLDIDKKRWEETALMNRFPHLSAQHDVHWIHRYSFIIWFSFPASYFVRIFF